jgi:catechol 2,3-dioxygenase-like lactoylglutathione lyase family enzyme
MPRLNGILETALYVDDLPRARRFYETVLQLTPLFSDHRLCAFDVTGRSILLLFKRGASSVLTTLPGGTIPPHDGSGPLHVALAVPADPHHLAERWDEHLLPRPRRTPAGAGHAGLMAELLGRRCPRHSPFPCAFLGTNIEH